MTENPSIKEETTLTGFDHSYTGIPSPDVFFNLSKRGFTPLAQMVEHPGGAECRFIPFERCTEISTLRKHQYLEFIFIRSYEEYIKIYQARRPEFFENNPDKLANFDKIVGYSLTINHSLPNYLAQNTNAWTNCSPKFEHKNYAWKNDAISKLPGWNFITFNHEIIKNTHVWITEYESDPTTRPASAPTPVEHQNTCYKIVGHILNVCAVEYLNNFVKITNCQVDTKNNCLILQDGTLLWFNKNSLFKDKCDELWNKTGAIIATVLACKDKSKFVQYANPDYQTTFNNKCAYGIKLPEQCYDILVIEE